MNDAIHPTNRTHIWLSLALYIACLFFDAYYLGVTREPNTSLNILLIGWMGFLMGNFCWFANMIYFAAIVLSFLREKANLIVAAAALLLALIFLFYKQIPVSEAPTYEVITGYGLGYFLWVLSMLVLLVGETLIALKVTSTGKQILIQLGVLMAASLAYAAYYYIGTNSLYAIQKQRAQYFSELCSTSGEYIFEQIAPVNSVLNHSNGFSEFSDVVNNEYSGSSWSLNLNATALVQAPDAAYEIISINTSQNLPEALGLKGEEIQVKRRATGQVIAKSSYVVSKNNRQICAHIENGTYSVSRFVVKALGLPVEQKTP